MANIIKIKRGLSSDINTAVLELGELAITTDTSKLYVGSTTGAPQPVVTLSKEEVQEMIDVTTGANYDGNLSKYTTKWTQQDISSTGAVMGINYPQDLSTLPDLWVRQNISSSGSIIAPDNASYNASNVMLANPIAETVTITIPSGLMYAQVLYNDDGSFKSRGSWNSTAGSITWTVDSGSQNFTIATNGASSLTKEEMLAKFTMVRAEGYEKSAISLIQKEKEPMTVEVLTDSVEYAIVKYDSNGVFIEKSEWISGVASGIVYDNKPGYQNIVVRSVDNTPIDAETLLKRINIIVAVPDVEYATVEYVDNAIANIDIPEVDLSNYTTTDEVNTMIDDAFYTDMVYIEPGIPQNGYYTATAGNPVAYTANSNSRAYLVDVSAYAGKTLVVKYNSTWASGSRTSCSANRAGVAKQCYTEEQVSRYPDGFSFNITEEFCMLYISYHYTTTDLKIELDLGEKIFKPELVNGMVNELDDTFVTKEYVDESINTSKERFYKEYETEKWIQLTSAEDIITTLGCSIYNVYNSNGTTIEWVDGRLRLQLGNCTMTGFVGIALDMPPTPDGSSYELKAEWVTSPWLEYACEYTYVHFGDAVTDKMTTGDMNGTLYATINPEDYFEITLEGRSNECYYEEAFLTIYYKKIETVREEITCTDYIQWNQDKTIKFYIDGTEYQAKSGATWAEWTMSKYNTCKAYIDSHYIHKGDTSYTKPFICEAGDSFYMSAYLEIIPGQSYTVYKSSTTPSPKPI